MNYVIAPCSMTAFARSITRSWVSRLWPSREQSLSTVTCAIEKDEEILEKQNKNFLNAIQNGGIWFS